MIIAVGTKMPGWVNEAFHDYAKRMPRDMKIELVEVRPEPRTSGKSTAQLLEAEAGRIARALPREASRVALDERGREFTTAELARWLAARRQDGRDIAFVIGGADGLAPEMKSGTGPLMRVSAMTLPHGLARVLLAEQLYRASSILNRHPYHRE
ncbi:MAG TPA: 23S rRNA (pseudouridine(1915)-N(3))-methyltransferase RlmH [Burkholderiales bacterium]